MNSIPLRKERRCLGAGEVVRAAMLAALVVGSLPASAQAPTDPGATGLVTAPTLPPAGTNDLGQIIVDGPTESVLRGAIRFLASKQLPNG